MFSDTEQEFLDAVVRCYLKPNPHTNCTQTIMSAAYAAARCMGKNIPGTDAEHVTFFDTFMGGLMRKSEALEYITEQINTHYAQEMQTQNNWQQKAERIRTAAQEQMAIIMTAAKEIRRLTSGLTSGPGYACGCYPIFSSHSTEMDTLERVSQSICIIGKQK